MKAVDLNLLPALDALLAEHSVTGAARRLGLSPSATSRSLARLRIATGDPLLVQAGRTLVPTPHAEALAERVRAIAQELQTVLAPKTAEVDPATLERTFTIRANEGFVGLMAADIVSAVTAAAPRVRLRFAPKPEKDVVPLREGRVDLEIGVAGASAPEMRSQLVFRDGFMGAVRLGHPLLDAAVTPDRYVAWGHVVASRRGAASGPVDDALRVLGLTRDVMAIVPGFPDAMGVARRSDLIALVPRSCFRLNDAAATGLACFALPVSTPDIAICAMWHPRQDADAAHRWLRRIVLETCRDLRNTGAAA